MGLSLDYQRLSDEVKLSICQNLHYWEYRDKTGTALSSSVDIRRMVEGGVERFHSDAIFKARVQSLTSSVIATVHKAVEDAAEKSRLEAYNAPV